MLTRLLFYFIQWTWGIPQNLAGFLVYILQAKDSRGIRYKNVLGARWNSSRGLSLGMFVFVSRDAGERMLRHEYGHSIQSLILGPFYLIAVGIPSLLWCRCRPIAARWQSGACSYYSVYPESWADRLGHVPENT